MTRRTAIAVSAAAPLLAAAGGPNPVRLGGPIFLKSEDPRELAREHRRLGYSAAYCPSAKASDTDRIKAIRDGFASENVIIAEVGVWKNLLDSDPAARKENMDAVIQGMALADAAGARCCVDIAGSYNPKVWYGPHPKNLSREFFDATVENCRKIIDSVKPTRSTFCVEMMGWNIPDSADSYLELIKAIDRKQFSVHIDMCNIVNSPTRFYKNSELISDTFRKLGRWIASCHAKDLAWIPEMNMHFVEVIPGRGEIDYKAYLREVAKLPQAAPLMLEHLKNAQEYDEGRNYIRKVGAENGITFA